MARPKAPNSVGLTARATTIASAAFVRLESPWSAKVQITRLLLLLLSGEGGASATCAAPFRLFIGSTPTTRPERGGNACRSPFSSAACPAGRTGPTVGGESVPSRGVRSVRESAFIPSHDRK